VRWGHDSGTRINPLADGSRMVAEMFRIRWYSISGKYGHVIGDDCGERGQYESTSTTVSGERQATGIRRVN
jgi:hypothetical protein